LSNYDFNNNNTILSETKLYRALYILIHCCVKGIHVDSVVSKLLKDIFYIIDCFSQHNTEFKSLAYGSTSNVYISSDNSHVYKIYNDKLRWTTVNHDNINSIFEREKNILELLYSSDIHIHNNTIQMKYLGKSLYNSFILPDNWKFQITNIFETFDKHGIYYPEFNIKNILVLNGVISFVDFGLATLTYREKSNQNNCKIFIGLIELIKTKFAEIEPNQHKLFYSTFINNLKIQNKYEENIY
jgi:hypothetical protein